MGCYTKIDGWFGDLEARLYQHQVARVSPPARFVEIGSWKGRSSHCMGEAIRRSGKQIDFWCVDTWQGSWEHQDMPVIQEDRLFETFLSNTADVRDAIQPLRMPSQQAAARFPDRSLDFVFIDAAHDFHNVLADIRAWGRKVKPDGVLAGHDYGSRRKGVIQAVEAAFDGEARVFGPCWFFAPQCDTPVPWSWRAWSKRGVWKLRRLCVPKMFQPESDDSPRQPQRPAIASS